MWHEVNKTIDPINKMPVIDFKWFIDYPPSDFALYFCISV